ncbi:hypothetical protein LF824_12010 [Citrobacter freundii]|nr:hypothetical protein [Citrobacter freundii]MCO5617454.1 hypothetical protein [Citrobacter freundii]MCO5626556.1 hypothetical protein [Citrobacter freundii]MCO5634402.1 hypothetical protein [Citrobacter freundii]MCO5639222.1 hypothetical protein [Citrobacter freundii]
MVTATTMVTSTAAKAAAAVAVKVTVTAAAAVATNTLRLSTHSGVGCAFESWSHSYLCSQDFLKLAALL